MEGWQQALTMILGASTLVSVTVALMQRARLKESTEAIKQLRVDLKTTDHTLAQYCRDTEILKVSVEGELKRLAEAVERIEAVVRGKAA